MTRAERMVSRWAGIRGPSRPLVNPTERIGSRQDVDSDKGASVVAATLDEAPLERDDVEGGRQVSTIIFVPKTLAPIRCW